MEPEEINYTKEQIDNLYQEAIESRNDGDIQNAEKLFLELAYRAHVRAMHNYAMIKFNKKEMAEAYFWLTTAAELGFTNSRQSKHFMEANRLNPKNQFVPDKKIELNLVVGSTRKNNQWGTSFSLLSDVTNCDASHRTSFNGIATTMDIEQCDLENETHIVGDAEKFSFDKYDIKAAYLERLPTFTDKSKAKGFSVDDMLKSQNAIISNIINNLSLAMKKGAKLELEYQPYLTTVSCFSRAQVEELHKTNPFHGVLNLTGFLEIMKDMLETSEHHLHPGLIATRPQQISGLFNFYAQQNVLHESLIKQNSAYTTLGSGFNILRTRCIEEIEHIVTILKRKPVDSNAIANVTENGIIGLVLYDLAVLENFPYIQNYFENNGFENVSMTRTTSPHNQRKNIWLISADKS